jgi:hypothetical protein
MAIDKIQSESINLADTFAFTGTVTGAGKILQVISSTTTAMTSHSRDAEMTNFLTAITPSSTSSKILCIVSLGLVGSDASADTGVDIRRKIGSGSFSSLQIGSGASNTNTSFVPFMGYGGGLATGGVGFQIVDSTNTTSEVSYQLQCRVNSGRTLFINRRGSSSDFGSSSGITLMEISG